MYYQSQDIRAATLAISESIKYRKNCFIQSKPTQQNKERLNILDQQNIKPLFYKQSKSLNTSVQSKKQSRRKAGSIVKITRNFLSNQKNQNKYSRKELTDASNYLNSKNNQYDNNNEQSVGDYKKLYQHNKVLNQALKSKLYQCNQRAGHPANALIGLSNYSYKDSNNQISRKISTQHQRQNQKNQCFNSKYTKMLDEYDKKKSFVKQELQAMKQKSSLQNFASFNSSTNQFFKTQNNFGPNSKYQSLQKSKQNCFLNRQNTYNNKIQRDVLNNKKQLIDIKAQPKNECNLVRNNKYSDQSQKQDQIDKKFRTYQQKISKHKDFEKRNLSISKKDVTSTKQQIVTNININKKQADLKRIQHTSTKKILSQSVRTFIDMISKQIEKDEQVRILKNQLKNTSLQQIQNIVKEKFQMKFNPEMFKLNTQEYDPFFQTSQSNDQTLQQQVRNLLNCTEISQNFWNNLIKGRFKRNELQTIYEALNYSKKDEIGLNELARQLSFYMNKTIRNRSVYSIYQRLSPLTKCNFVQILTSRSK